MVKDGIGAVPERHRASLDGTIRGRFADSVDIDEGLKRGREKEHRWDYLLGYETNDWIIGVEPHSAENSEIGVIISKVKAARRQLGEHLRDGVFVSRWLWVATGRVHLLPLETASLRLKQHGIDFVGRVVRQKHLG